MRVGFSIIVTVLLVLLLSGLAPMAKADQQLIEKLDKYEKTWINSTIFLTNIASQKQN